MLWYLWKFYILSFYTTVGGTATVFQNILTVQTIVLETMCYNGIIGVEVVDLEEKTEEIKKHHPLPHSLLVSAHIAAFMSGKWTLGDVTKKEFNLY